MNENCYRRLTSRLSLQWNTFNMLARRSFMFIYVDTAESIIALLLTIIVIVIGRMMRIALSSSIASSFCDLWIVGIAAESAFWVVRKLEDAFKWHVEWIVMCGGKKFNIERDQQDENESKDWSDIYHSHLTFHDLFPSHFFSFLSSQEFIERMSREWVRSEKLFNYVFINKLLPDDCGE